MDNIVIIGGKGTAINIAEQIEDARNRFGYPMRVAGFAIDDPSLGDTIAGFPILWPTRETRNRVKYTDHKCLFALYRPDVMHERVALLREFRIPRERFANFVHPLAYVSPTAQMGVGNVVLSQASIQHGVRIGDFNVINSGVVIEHEASVMHSAFVAAQACIGARAKLGVGAFIGLSSAVREDVVVGDFAFVGMGAVVLRNVPQHATVYGVPAKRQE